jgi:hypothetical protein
MVPYIEKIAQPGMRVVFLIRFSPPTVSKASRHDSMESQYPEESAFFDGKLAKPQFTRENVRGTQSMEEQRRSAEHKVFLALEALLKRGIEITVDVYTGCLRRAVKSYTCKGDVHLIVMRAKSELVMNFLHKAFAIFGLVKQPTFSPILVLHPTAAV